MELICRILTRVCWYRQICPRSKKSYSKDLADISLQVERYVIGTSMMDIKDTRDLSMKVGRKSVLFRVQAFV